MKWDNLLNLCPRRWNRVPHRYSLNQPPLCVSPVLNARDLKTRSPFSCSIGSNEGRRVTKKSIKRKAVLESGRCCETNKVRKKDLGTCERGHCRQWAESVQRPSGSKGLGCSQGKRPVSLRLSEQVGADGRVAGSTPGGRPETGRDRQAYNNAALTGCWKMKWGLTPWSLPFQKGEERTFLRVQWLRIGLPMLGTRVRSLVWEVSTYLGATKPVCHSTEPACS